MKKSHENYEDYDNGFQGELKKILLMLRIGLDSPQGLDSHLYY